MKAQKIFAVLLSVAGLLAAPADPVRKAAPRASVSPGTSLARALSLHDRIAQMIVVRGYGDYPDSDNAEYKRFERWIRQDHVGGFIVAGRIRNGSVIAANPFEMAVFINHMQHVARTPLLVASDFERGASMRVAETAPFPYMMAFGAAHDLDATRQLGSATAREARAMGVNWVFAPDADVNNNPDNPIINTRSFGEDPQAVAANVAAFIDGAHADPKEYVLVAPKHFPGHGDTAQDSHLQLPQLTASRERIEAVELKPFRAAIEQGADAIMTAHLEVPALDPAAVPATVSHRILTGLLRDELKFKGLIVTDALEMQGIASLYSQGEAAVRAVDAGADVLLMPIDPEPCIRAIEAAVRSRRIPIARINESAGRILAAKQKLGLYRSRTVSLDAIPDLIDAKQLDDLANSVAIQALTLFKDEKQLIPASGPGACLVVMTEGEFSTRGEILTQRLSNSLSNLNVYLTNASTPPAVLNAITADTLNCKQIYVAAFVTVAAGRGSVALQGGLNTFMDSLLHRSVPVALISFGNPYLLRQFPDVAAYLATFSTAQSSESAVASALLGQVPISGKSPVSIPPVAHVGDGLTVPAKATVASNRAQ